MTAISSKAITLCDCCQRERPCKMYVLQDGNTAFVCDDCRNGKEPK